MKRKHGLTILLVCLCLAGFPVLASVDGEHGFDWPRLVAQIVNSLIFFGALYYFLRKPAAKFFTERLKGIREALDLAEKSREQAKQRLDEIERKMAHLDEERIQIENQAKEEAERERQRIVTEAEGEARRIIAMAKAEIENRHREAVLELKAFVATLAIEEAETLIRQTINDEDRQRLFESFSQRLGVKS